MKSKLYSEHENFATENCWHQDQPRNKCSCGKRRCTDPKCCRESRAEHARRYRIVLHARLRKAKRDQQTCNYGNANFGVDIPLVEAAKVISKFQAGIKDLQAEIKWFLQISPSNVAHVHLHFIVLSWDRISQETIRALWTKALGEWYSPRKSSVYFKRPQSLKGIAKYVTGDTKKKFNDPLFRKGLPRQVKVSGGTIKFFAGPVDKLYKAIARHHRAWLEFRAADDDGWWNRIQSGTDLQAHYLAVVDADHEAYLDHAFDRRAGMPLPAVEDWEALFATTPPTPPLPIYKTTTRPQLPLEAEEVPLEAEEVAPAVEATPANIQENSEDRLRQVHEFATEGLPPRHGGGVPPPYVKGEARRRNTPFETSKGTQRHQLVPNPGRPSPIEAPPRPLRSP